MNEKKFDKMGEIYAQYRPSYPIEFINYLHNDIGINDGSIVADIGSGTGKLTKLLLTLGCKTYAVEPNSDMRAVAEREMNSFSNFVSINGTAEKTELPNQSINFITVAQAFHWFDAFLFKKECKRITAKNAKVVLVWNSRNPNAENVIECDKINRKYCPNFTGFSGGSMGLGNEDHFNNFFEGGYTKKIVNSDLVFTEDAFIGRQLSSSYALKQCQDGYDEYILELKNLFQKHQNDGLMILPQNTVCYIGNV